MHHSGLFAAHRIPSAAIVLPLNIEAQLRVHVAGPLDAPQLLRVPAGHAAVLDALPHCTCDYFSHGAQRLAVARDRGHLACTHPHARHTDVRRIDQYMVRPQRCTSSTTPAARCLRACRRCRRAGARAQHQPDPCCDAGRPRAAAAVRCMASHPRVTVAALCSGGICLRARSRTYAASWPSCWWLVRRMHTWPGPTRGRVRGAAPGGMDGLELLRAARPRAGAPRDRSARARLRRVRLKCTLP